MSVGLDTSFDTDGKLTTDFGSVENAYGVWIGPDNKITVAGRTGTNGAIYDVALARYKVSSGLERRIYVQQDANHNVSSISDTFGQVLQRTVYDPQGMPTILSSGWNTTGDSLDWKHYFQGKEFDPVTATYNFNARIYDPSLGRFLQVDRLLYVDGANAYQAMRGNALSWLDPSGLAVKPGPTPLENALQEAKERQRAEKQLAPQQAYDGPTIQAASYRPMPPTPSFWTRAKGLGKAVGAGIELFLTWEVPVLNWAAACHAGSEAGNGSSDRGDIAGRGGVGGDGDQERPGRKLHLDDGVQCSGRGVFDNVSGGEFARERG